MQPSSKLKPPILVVLLLMLVHYNMMSQVLDERYQITVGGVVNLNHNTSGHALKNNFSSIKAYIGFNGTHTLALNKKNEVNRGLLNYGISLTIYNRSLGNSLNILYQDNQIDLTTSITMGLLQHPNLPYMKQLQTINNSPFYNLRHNARSGIFISSNFILNNNRRHQTVGAITLTAEQVSVNYYNDGGPIIGQGPNFNPKKFLSYLLLPLHLVSGLGDGFDRWWTGGGGVYYHSREEYNHLEVTFDQFTGYHKLAFELGSIFGSDVQDYDLFQDMHQDTVKNKLNMRHNKTNSLNYNSSAYGIKYFFNQNLAANFGLIGSLRDHKNERFYAIQDIIHVLKRDPIHPNTDINRIFYGVTYNKPIHAQ